MHVLPSIILTILSYNIYFSKSKGLNSYVTKVEFNFSLFSVDSLKAET